MCFKKSNNFLHKPLAKVSVMYLLQHVCFPVHLLYSLVMFFSSLQKVQFYIDAFLEFLVISFTVLKLRTWYLTRGCLSHLFSFPKS